MNNQFSENGNRMADTSDNTEFSSVEYFKSLEKWVQDVTFWQYFNSVTFHSFLINQTATARLSGITPGAPAGPRRAPRRPVVSPRPERIRGNFEFSRQYLLFTWNNQFYVSIQLSNVEFLRYGND